MVSEWANVVDSVIGDYNLNQDYFPPELRGVEDGKWTTACDMWQFGKLLLLWNNLDEAGECLMKAQCSESPCTRLTAKESLTHDFFSQQD